MPEEVDALATLQRQRPRQPCWSGATPTTSTSPTRETTDRHARRIERLPFEADRVRVRHWRIDAEHSNSHTAWQAAGRTTGPSEAQLRAIKDRQGLELLEPDREEAIQDGALVLRIPFPLPSVSLIEIRPLS